MRPDVCFRPIADIHAIDEQPRMGPSVNKLSIAIARCRGFLAAKGEQHISARLKGLEERLARQDLTGIVSAVSEATGGMGSLNDVSFGSSHLDAEFRVLVLDVERQARAAAAANHIALVR